MTSLPLRHWCVICDLTFICNIINVKFWTYNLNYEKRWAWLGVQSFESLRRLKRGQFGHFMCWKFHARVARFCLVPMLGYNGTIVRKYWYQSKVCLAPVLITIWYQCQVIMVPLYFFGCLSLFWLKQLVTKAFSRKNILLLLLLSRSMMMWIPNCNQE